MANKPVSIRKFWIETACEDAIRHATGTVKDAGFTTTVHVKYNGEPYKAVEIHGLVDTDTKSLLLMVTIYPPDGDMIGHIVPFEQGA